MQRMLVEERRWIGQQRFLFALSFCTLLPGPEAQQLATYVGWLLNGIRGALIAGVLFVLPGMAALLALSAIYVGYGDTSAVEAVFLGLGPAVIAIVVQALARVGRRALTETWQVVVAVCSLPALAFFALPFPVVIAGAALVGWVVGRRPKTGLQPRAKVETASGHEPLISDAALHHERPSRRHSLLVLVVGLASWFARCSQPQLCSDRTACSSSRESSSPVPPWSRSAVLTQSWPTWPSRRSTTITG
jgi:chromate transporter